MTKRAGFEGCSSIGAKVAGMLVIGSAMFIPALSAAVVTFTDSGSWQAAVGGTTVIDFEGIAPAEDYVSEPTISGMTITASSYYVVSATYNGGVDSLNGSDSMQAGYSVGATVELLFATDLTAFGTLIGFTTDNPAPPAGVFTATLFNGGVQVGATFTSSSLQSGFIGFTSSESFDRVVFENTNFDTFLTYDNVAFEPVPEPATVGLMILGGGVLSLRRKRR